MAVTYAGYTGVTARGIGVLSTRLKIRLAGTKHGDVSFIVVGSSSL